MIEIKGTLSKVVEILINTEKVRLEIFKKDDGTYYSYILSSDMYDVKPSFGKLEFAQHTLFSEEPGLVKDSLLIGHSENVIVEAVLMYLTERFPDAK